ncbi:homocysteine S-methyltransferase family protein [Veronia pacifica]|uniref:Homocysteine methyltransferase n=1 Tax=Veronia pacifica TaxID=1080227 RepID=A0A1C3EL56_9GAMM|nr:homocysteine S-methyltransferase family protein [Veronia pacifica]ODA33955.1 homocysteine methyltransferase [Veronia pacifica]
MFVLLDGGIGRELLRIGAPFSQPLWSAQALIEAPEFVLDAHMNFIDAGCDIITVNSYACVPFHLGEDMFTQSGHKLAERAARLARKAADTSGTEVKVAGCIPPALGSYRPDLFDANRVLAITETLIDAQQAYVDLWLVETISSIDEFRCIHGALKLSDKPKYFAFTLDDVEVEQPTLRSGESVREAVDMALRREVDGILFNCSQPEVMKSALELARAVIIQERQGTLTGIYANGFDAIYAGHEANDGLSRERGISPKEYADFANTWLDAGADLIGGCCAIFPQHIAELDKLRKEKRR